MERQCLLCVACVCFACVACGTPATAELSSTSAEHQALEAAVRLPGGTEARVRARYHDLKKAGALDDRNWKVNTQPPELRYAEILLEDDAEKGISDGYYVTALVPTEDPQGVHRFFVNRIGGVSGWQFLAGPFALQNNFYATTPLTPPVPPTVIINEQNAGGTVPVARGATVVAELSSNPSTGYAWLVGAPAEIGEPVRQYVADQPNVPGAPGTERLTWNSVMPQGQPGQILVLHFVYKRPWEQGVLRDFTITLQLQ